jgi:hypothetical protein
MTWGKPGFLHEPLLLLTRVPRVEAPAGKARLSSEMKLKGASVRECHSKASVRTGIAVVAAR